MVQRSASGSMVHQSLRGDSPLTDINALKANENGCSLVLLHLACAIQRLCRLRLRYPAGNLWEAYGKPKESLGIYTGGRKWFRSAKSDSDPQKVIPIRQEMIPILAGSESLFAGPESLSLRVTFLTDQNHFLRIRITFVRDQNNLSPGSESLLAIHFWFADHFRRIRIICLHDQNYFSCGS